MTEGDNPASSGRQPAAPVERRAHPDILVIGGGIMGLWAAQQAARAGARVLLTDAAKIGQGASGGLLGALMPHTPDRWSDKKQFQFEALLSLEEEIAGLESRIGLSAGYRRAGRLIPLAKPHLHAIALRHNRDAGQTWQGEKQAFHWHVRTDLSEIGLAADVIDPGAIAEGYVEDTLAARVSPRRYGALLAAALRASPSVDIAESRAVTVLDPVARLAECADGSRISFGHAIIANGHDAGGLVASLMGGFSKPLVVPVKGQSALLAASLPPDMPVIYRDGLYIVPHEDGTVAIGSTSENSFDAPFTTDERLEALLREAVALMPGLAHAPILERWAGLRPKAIGRDPLAGLLPGEPHVSVLTGGFKISFGIAHHLAQSVVLGALGIGGGPVLPASFAPEAHFAAAGPVCD